MQEAQVHEVPAARSESESESEASEQSESESYLTCDSGVSDDDGTNSLDENSAILCSTPSKSHKRSRSSSDGEFSDALDRSAFALKMKIANRSRSYRIRFHDSFGSC